MRASSSGTAQDPSYSSYTESPLRKVQLQTEVGTCKQTLLRPPSSHDVNRRSSNRSLQSSIFIALGSSEPVDLLPHISKRASSSSSRKTNVTFPDETSTPPAVGNATTDTMFTDGAQSPTQEGQGRPTPAYAYPWVLDEVLYATPPGCGSKDGS